MNREIVDYTIIDHLSVRKYIKDWWQPFWSPFVKMPREHWYEYICQAMVKYAPLPDTTDNEWPSTPIMTDEEIENMITLFDLPWTDDND